MVKELTPELKNDIINMMIDIIKFPNGTICKHYIVLKILSLMEKYNYNLDENLVDAILNGDDDMIIEFFNKMLII